MIFECWSGDAKGDAAAWPASSGRTSGVRRKNPADGPGRKPVSGRQTAAKISRAHGPACPEHAKNLCAGPCQRRSTGMRNSLWIWNRICGWHGRRSRKYPNIAWLPRRLRCPAVKPGRMHHPELPPDLLWNDRDEILMPKHGLKLQSASHKPGRSSARQKPMPRQGPASRAGCRKQQGCRASPSSAPSATASPPVRRPWRAAHPGRPT